MISQPEQKKYKDIWQELQDKIPIEDTPEHLQKREKLFQEFDINKNGLLSLAEVDRGCTNVLNLPHILNIKTAIRRAFDNAKTLLEPSNSHGDDNVSKAEFKYLLVYIRLYYEYTVAFNQLDANHDKKISLEQFKAAKQTMQKWGINVKNDEDLQTMYHQIDKDKSGKVSFDQFADWAWKMNIYVSDKKE